jgi:hypothetical protein
MIRSLKRYFKLFVVTLLLKKEKLILLNHFIGYFFSKSYLKGFYTKADKKQSLDLCIGWLLSAHKNMIDGGMGTYHIVGGWSSSYPETSGYIIPTLYNYALIQPSKKNEIERTILACADWLVSIQKPSGGWQSAYIEHQRPEVVFNTGQVLRGLLIAYQMDRKNEYKESLCKACDWLVETQEPDGSWKKTAYMNEPRVYDSYVAHPLLLVYELTGNESYKEAAIKNLNWILTQQIENGWLMNADNTQKHNNRPILHTISYTIDGLINCGVMLKNDAYVAAGKKAADRLLTLFEQNRVLGGRYDSAWMASEYMICTGCAQISIVWLLLHELTGDKKYAAAAERMNSQLVAIQHSCLTIGGSGNGALPGSYPIWGKYEPFTFPNWATKYFADALMSELKP